LNRGKAAELGVEFLFSGGGMASKKDEVFSPKERDCDGGNGAGAAEAEAFRGRFKIEECH